MINIGKYLFLFNQLFNYIITSICSKKSNLYFMIPKHSSKLIRLFNFEYIIANNSL